MEKLGIEPSLLITQIVNFTIMIFILGKELETIDKRHETVLNQARKEAKAILEDAKKDGRKLKEEMLTEGKNEVSHLKQKLEKEMKNREEEIQAEMTSHTVEIAAEMVKRLIPEVLKDESQHQLILKQLERIEKTHEKRQS